MHLSVLMKNMKFNGFRIEIALESDLEEILSLQKCAYISEAEIINDFSIQPLTQTIYELIDEFKSSTILKAVDSDKIIGSVRAFERDCVCHIGKLIVHPNNQNKGIGKILLNEVEKRFNSCRKYSLFTSKESTRNLYFYNKAGYRITDEKIFNDKLTLVNLEKENSQPLR
jgi:ribosomal protein S18 acetylase RimI-like enzyme